MSKIQKSNRIVLASGDFANTHAVVSTKQMSYEHKENSVIKFNVDKEATITHEEHDIIKLMTGTYYKYNQVELNPFNNTVSFVFD